MLYSRSLLVFHFKYSSVYLSIQDGGSAEPGALAQTSSPLFPAFPTSGPAGEAASTSRASGLGPC